MNSQMIRIYSDIFIELSLKKKVENLNLFFTKKLSKYKNSTFPNTFFVCFKSLVLSISLRAFWFKFSKTELSHFRGYYRIRRSECLDLFLTRFCIYRSTKCLWSFFTTFLQGQKSGNFVVNLWKHFNRKKNILAALFFDH